MMCLLIIPATIRGADNSSTNNRPAASRMSPIHKAMVMLEENRFGMAERLATIALNDKTNPSKDSHRAWLIIAMSRKGRGQYADAIKAYDEYLKNNLDSNQKKFAISQKQDCSQLANQASSSTSEKISAKQLYDFSKIDPRSIRASSKHFIIHARNRKLAEFMAKRAEIELDRILQKLPLDKLGLDKKRKVDLHIWPDEKQYKAATGNIAGHSGGMFTPDKGKNKRLRIDLIQLDKNGHFSKTSIDHVLPHEICHILFHTYSSSGPADERTPLPLSINEGLAMTMEQKIVNRRIMLAGSAMAGNDRTFIPLQKLLSTQNYSEIDNISLFYAESYSFVQFLWQWMDASQMGEFLSQLRGGANVETSLQRAMLLPDSEDLLGQIEEKWRDYAVMQRDILKSLSKEKQATSDK